MKRYCIVSHTHWDREWYLPLENFRMRLVDLFDNLLDILEKDSGYRFNMDAQTIVLEDYLEIRPEKRKLLEKYVSEGKILVGPWYVQNDFHLTSGEATVRNLIIGTDMAKSFGRCMNVGYAADQFGLISQLPQILHRFGLESCIFGRGFDRGVTEFIWKSEDGSEVLCEHMKFWYNNAQRFSDNIDGALRLLRDRGALCAQYCAGENYLLMNGVDHLEAQENLTGIIEEMRKHLDADEEVIQDTLPDFAERVRKDITDKGIKLNTYTGEFRDNGAGNVLTGTLSSRIYLKKMNTRAQAGLEKRLEPMYSLLSSFGIKDYPQDYMTYLWKLLINNHPHDSICGCSIDAVHRHMVDRFERIEENTTDLLSRGTDILNSHLSSEKESAEDYRVIIFNPAQLTSDRSVEVNIDIPVSEEKGGFEIFDERGQKVQYTVLEITKNYRRRILSPINLPGELVVNRYRTAVSAEGTPGMSYHTLSVRLCEGETNVNASSVKKKNILENNHIRAAINSNGTVDLTDKRSGIKYKGILALEDGEDTGNSYNFYPGSSVITSEGAEAEITDAFDCAQYSERTVKYRLNCAHNLRSGVLDITMKLRLYASSDELNVELCVNNTFDHHRTRVLIPTGIQSDTNYAGQPFDCIIRDKVSRFADDACHPDTDYVGVEDNSHGIAVLNEGLYEYEHMTDDRGTLALTVLRSVTRVTGSLEEEENPVEGWDCLEGACLGDNVCRFAVVPYSGSHVSAKIIARAQRFMSPSSGAFRSVNPNRFIGGRPFVQGPGMPDIFYRPIEHSDVVLPHSFTAFELTASIPNAMIVSAFKKSRDGKGMILRVYNSTSVEVALGVMMNLPFTSVEKVNLAEENGTPVLDEEGAISLSTEPKEIVTLKFI